MNIHHLPSLARLAMIASFFLALLPTTPAFAHHGWAGYKGIYRTVADWDVHALPPMSAKVSALVSAFVWTGVIVAGRFLAY